MKKVLLVNPHKLIPRSLSVTQRPSPPLGLAYIASVFENSNFEVDVLDCVAEAPDTYTPYKEEHNILTLGIAFEKIAERVKDHYDVVGLSFMFSNNWLVNRDLADYLRTLFPNAIFIAGGEHVSAIPEYCLNECKALDIVVSGEGEETMEELARYINEGRDFELIDGISLRKKDGEIVTNQRRKRIRSLDEISEPSWHLFPLDKYFSNNLSYGIAYGNSLPIFSTRGCPYECTFCSSPQMWGKKYSLRNVELVVHEIKKLNQQYNVTNIDFYDLTAIINRKWILDFCNLVIKEGLKITWQIPAGTRAEAIDYEVSRALFLAGCKNITYAPESGSERMLEYVKKRVRLEKMLFSIKESNRAGLNVKLNIIMGYPDEKLTDILWTIWFLIKASYYGANDASPSIFSPYPGSELFDELLRNGELELSDKYFRKIVASESFHDFVNYNRHNSKATMIFMQYLGYLAFYTSNYIFRPGRLFSLIKNLFTGKAETRGEWMIKEMFDRFRYFKRNYPKTT